MRSTIRKVLGIDLGGTNIRAAVVNGNALENLHSVPLEKDLEGYGIVDRLVQLIQEIQPEEPAGIGIGVPSYVDVEEGIVYDTVNLPGWGEMPVKRILEKETGIPVFINNDANCFALGEKHFGKGKPYRSIVGMTLGTGIGTGIIINGQLYYGKNCGAGEICNTPFRDKTYEYYGSSEFFRYVHHTTALETYERAEKGDKIALAIFHDYGINLGEFLKVVLLAYDPEAIIVGGSISKAYAFFSEGIFEALENFYFQQYVKNLQLLISETEHIALYGAAQLCLDH